MHVNSKNGQSLVDTVGPVVSGYVDRVWSEGVAGWSPAPNVMVSVNGRLVESVPCSDMRPDVQAAKASVDGRVGFHAQLSLDDGDIVRVTTPQGKPLHHSPWLYLPPESDGWLPASLTANHPEYSGVADFSESLAWKRFQPLFGQLGDISAVKFDSGDGPMVAHPGMSPDDAGRIHRFYKRVLTPAGIASPALRHQQGIGERQMLIFDFFPGKPLDRHGPGWEAWLPAVMVELERLQQFGEQHREGLKVRGGRKPPLVNHLFRQALGDALRWDRAHGERRFLLWLVTRLKRLPQVLSHGDLHRENVLVDTERGNIALVDWDRWDYLPVGFDLARLMRGLAGDTVEQLTGGSHAQRLGVVGFTYLLQRHDRPAMVNSEEGEALRRRCRELAGSLL